MRFPKFSEHEYQTMMHMNRIQFEIRTELHTQNCLSVYLIGDREKRKKKKYYNYY